MEVDQKGGASLLRLPLVVHLTAFRSESYCIQPTHNIIKLMFADESRVGSQDIRIFTDLEISHQCFEAGNIP